MREMGLLIFFLISITSWGQSPYPTAKELRKLFMEKGSNDFWISCNDDSIYFNKDTVQLFRYVNYKEHSKDCCQFVQWRFQKGFEIKFNQAQVCTELRVKTLYKNRKLKISVRKGTVYLEVISAEDGADKFKVVSLSSKELWTDGKITDVLTLKREKK